MVRKKKRKPTLRQAALAVVKYYIYRDRNGLACDHCAGIFPDGLHQPNCEIHTLQEALKRRP
jgi:hypothetical protein